MDPAGTDARSASSLRRALAVVVIAAVLVQLAYLGLAIHATGRVDGFALRSVDGREFMRLARGLAWHGRFSQDEAPPFWPDTWRVPGYPLLLAGGARLFGDGTLGPIVVQQVLAVISVGLLMVIASRWASPRVAGAVGVLWLLDPYRGYYSLWILSGTWFVLLLLLAVWVWQRWWMGRRGGGLAFVLGALVGLLVLTRPIGVVLVPLALLGVAAARGGGKRRAARLAACLVGVSIMLGPWVVRNKLVGGRFALSHQGGTVLAYFKAVEVVLWAERRTGHRHDDEVVHAVWERFDQRLRTRWSIRHGPLTPQARQDIAWPQIAWGRVRALNPLLLDREIMGLGLDVLAEHPEAAVSCWAWRCVSILTFPLSLAVAPPETTSALPFANILPDVSVSMRRVFAGLLAAPFVVLTVVAFWRAVGLLRARRFVLVATCALPLLAFLVATSPQLDPRFRVPMVPFLLLLATARRE